MLQESTSKTAFLRGRSGRLRGSSRDAGPSALGKQGVKAACNDREDEDDLDSIPAGPRRRSQVLAIVVKDQGEEDIGQRGVWWWLVGVFLARQVVRVSLVQPTYPTYPP